MKKTFCATLIGAAMAVFIASAQAAGDAPAPVPRTGQTQPTRPGSDGALQKGVVWPIPRFTDNANGTVTDNLTGLIWLKNANCFSDRLGWSAGLDRAGSLANGECGLSDGSVPGDWRMPNRNELTSLLDLGNLNPALPTGNPFTNFQLAREDRYWSSTEAGHKNFKWCVIFGDGAVAEIFEGSFANVTFVRGP